MLADSLVEASDSVLRAPPQPWWCLIIIIIIISESELISDIHHSYPKEKKISAPQSKHLQLCHYLHYSPAMKCNKGRPLDYDPSGHFWVVVVEVVLMGTNQRFLKSVFQSC
jgi:hypothetical protein